MTVEIDTPRIYVRCLASYVNGTLHGDWIDCNQCAEYIMADIDQILASSPTLEAEEWAIHDFENWHGIDIDEYENVEKLAMLAELLQIHGPAFAAYYNDESSEVDKTTLSEGFEENYVGEYKSEEDFAYHLWEELGTLDELEKLNISESYLDWNAISRDIFIDSYWSHEVTYNEVYVFRRY